MKKIKEKPRKEGKSPKRKKKNSLKGERSTKKHKVINMKININEIPTLNPKEPPTTKTNVKGKTTEIKK